jgi:hypothetical protein
VRSAGTADKPRTALDFWQRSYWEILVEVRVNGDPHLQRWEAELQADEEIERLEKRLENDLRLKGESNLPELPSGIHRRARKPEDR